MKIEKPEIIDFGKTDTFVHCSVHWYVGVYSNGVHIYNKCARCGKRQSI